MGAAAAALGGPYDEPSPLSTGPSSIDNLTEEESDAAVDRSALNTSNDEPSTTSTRPTPPRAALPTTAKGAGDLSAKPRVGDRVCLTRRVRWGYHGPIRRYVPVSSKTARSRERGPSTVTTTATATTTNTTTTTTTRTTTRTGTTTRTTGSSMTTAVAAAVAAVVESRPTPVTDGDDDDDDEKPQQSATLWTYRRPLSQAEALACAAQFY
eukprot:Selendium_serpulae@DN11462_c0_g1_i1.p1